MTYCLETQDLSKVFWRKIALKNINLSIEEGSISAIVGPNGAGKSTLLKLLVNLLKPSSGKSTIFGKDSASMNAQDFNNISFVSEQQRLPERMKLVHVLEYCSTVLAGWDQHYVGLLIRDFELDPVQKIGSFSRGNKARIRMIIAMGGHPKLLLLDEVFGGLDPIARDDMTDAVIDIVQKFGTTVLFATHEMNEVERLADTIAFLNHAQLHHVQSTEELLDSYRLIDIEGEAENINQLAEASNFYTLDSDEKRSRYVAHVDALYSFERSTTNILKQPNISVFPAELKQIFRHLKNASETGEAR